MHISYSQTTGHITTDDGVVVAEGWAGNGPGKNSPAMQDVSCVGPLPRGLWSVGHWEAFHDGLGPLVARLTQVEGDSFRRDGFFIHGSAKDPLHFGQESKGCIVIPRPGREAVKALNPTILTVTE